MCIDQVFIMKEELENNPDQVKRESVLEWTSTQGAHTDRAFGQISGISLRPRSADRVVELPLSGFRNIQHSGYPLEPRLGRFYPPSVLEGIPGDGGQAKGSVRVLSLGSRRITVDLNHPLSFASTGLRISYPVSPGRIFSEEVSTAGLPNGFAPDGPGMQAPVPGIRTDFEEPGAFSRQDDRPDTEFYGQPRMVRHVDEMASGFIREIYARFLKPGQQVLDLMSSLHSHLPPDMGLQVTGLGLNREEMVANTRLTRRMVHDLNRDPALPFEDGEFDTVLCSLSVEYLINPLEIARESARVLKSGGSFLVSFSNRWFPPKVTRLWTLLHPFERMGWVLQLLEDTGSFGGLFTESARGFPRSADDPYYPELSVGDPVFVVGGIRL